MLEQFLLTQKDCVAYYAFAEDNHPDGPHRTTTDLRFIDIRPFLSKSFERSDIALTKNSGKTVANR